MFSIPFQLGAAPPPHTFPQLVSTRYTTRDGLPAGPVQTVTAAGGRIIVTANGGAYELAGAYWRLASAPPVRTVPPGAAPTTLPDVAQVTSWARTRFGEVWATTATRAVRIRDGRASPLELPAAYRLEQLQPHVDAVVRRVAADGAGQIWLATDHGVLVTDGRDWWHPLTGADGMPFEDVLCLAFAPNGDLWGGTTEGAWRLRGGQWSYFRDRRWLPGNRVNDIAVGTDGSAWLATDGGVARIDERPTRLADKAAHYEEIVRLRHDRRGWVTACDLKVAGDPAAGFTPQASDNDGLWTALYVGAEALRYGVTDEPDARARGHRSLEALLDLVRLSGYSGFPARAILRKGEAASGYDPAETVRVPGETEPIWYTPPGYPDLLCKGDTSSDELDGHYFAWYLYYTHVADEHEKAEIREVCRAVTDNLLAHGYTLVGHTGRRTRWGVFGPQFLNDDPRWSDERGLNSLSLLTYLKVAAHICGDARYSAAYEDLIANHHYLLNILNVRPRSTPWWEINHSDDELAYLGFYSLLQLEQDPHRRAILLTSLRQTWTGPNGLEHEGSPFYSFIYAACLATHQAADARIADAVETLQDWPWELVDWTMRNSRRSDVALRIAPAGRNATQADRVLPASERALMRWNGDPWAPDGGSDGRAEEDAAAWLLPYWLGRWHGLVAE